MQNKRGQITIFIIIAVIIVAAVALYFLFRGTLGTAQIPASLEPAYTSFLSCLEDNTRTGIDVLESQAGYIYLPELELGSHYYPFNSQLVFLGSSIPYWYYVSGNGIQKEQLPTVNDMESQLETFIENRIRDCNFQTHYNEGFVVQMDEPSASVSINDDSVDVSLNMVMTIEKGEDVAIVRSHNKKISSNLGSLYDSAMQVYDYEQDNLFIENYSIDALRLYAPVDGVELSCSPLIWSADKVFDDLQVALEQNMLVLGSNLGGGYYKVDADIPEDTEVRFLNDKTWPSTFEVSPSEENVLIASPVGNQPGLGVLGFCYIPYHYVYNVRYPVLIQVEKGEETFQFPMAVVIEGNKPREALSGASATEIGVPDLCQYKNAPLEVYAFDSNLVPVDADISYECFSEVCNLGSTENGVLKANFPQCVNGYVIAKAEGYEKGKVLHSTTSDVRIVNVLLEKTHNLNINLRLNGQSYNGDALVTFVKDGSSRTVAYPEQKNVELSQGQYEVQVYVYRNSSLQFPEATKTECIEIPAGGIGGILGFTTEKCVDIKIPSQIISSVLAGGGKQEYYVLESELVSSNTVDINAPNLPLPTSIEQLQTNYMLFEDNNLDIMFR